MMMGLSLYPKPSRPSIMNDIDKRQLLDDISWLTENLYKQTGIPKPSLLDANSLANITKYEVTDRTLIIGDDEYIISLDTITFLEYRYDGGTSKPYCVFVHVKDYLPQGIKIGFRTSDYAKTCLKTLNRLIFEQRENKILET